MSEPVITTLRPRTLCDFDPSRIRDDRGADWDGLLRE